MANTEFPETPHERRVTWSLIGVVVGFVLLMTCIVIWITSSILREELGGASQPGQDSASGLSATAGASTPALAPVLKGPAKATNSPTASFPALGEESSPATGEDGPALVQATWTPARKAPYVRFLYWYTKPNRVKLGDCVQITWETQYAVRLTLYRDGEVILDDAPTSQTIQDCPIHTGYNVYRLVGWNASEESNWVQLQVKVDKAP